MPYHWQIGPNRDATITPHVYTGVLPAIEAKYRELNSLGAFQLGGFLTYGTIDSIDPTSTDPPSRARLPRLFRRQRPLAARSGVEHHRVAPRRDRQDGHPPLRHHQRRPAAQRRQCRADHARQLHLDRRLGVPGPARRRPPEADPDRPAGDRRPLPLGRRRRRQVESRPTASRSCGSTARTRSAPSPACDGTCGG